MMHALWATVIWATLSAHAPGVEVRSERVHLGQLVPRMPEPWASVDLGAAPEPLQHRFVTAGEIARSVARARLQALPMAVPDRTEIRRAGASVSEPELRTLLQQTLAGVLPDVFALRSLSVQGGIVAGAGAMQVSFDNLHPREGKQTLMAAVATEDGIVRDVPVLVDLHRTVRETGPVMERGQDIVILLNHGSVHVQSTGTAQAPGAVGEFISVMPTNGTRVLRGRVIDARTVEVQG